MKKLIFIICILSTLSSLYAYESQEKLQAAIIGKIAKFITWEDSSSEKFVITILNNDSGNTFEKLYKNKHIKGKKVEIKYISNINQLSFTNILYIPKVTSKELKNILNKSKSKNILTISDTRGFAEKNGMVQVYFISQKPKLKINLDIANQENLKIKSSLLKIADVVKGDV